VLAVRLERRIQEVRRRMSAKEKGFHAQDLMT
jgi:hypothetical protein